MAAYSPSVPTTGAWRETGGMGLAEAPGIKHIHDKFEIEIEIDSGFAFPNRSEGTFRDGFCGSNLQVAAAVPGSWNLCVDGVRPRPG